MASFFLALFHKPPRLNTTKLPLIQLTDADFVAALIGLRTPNAGLPVFKRAARFEKCLMKDGWADRAEDGGLGAAGGCGWKG
jgi:hypothetical protein